MPFFDLLSPFTASLPTWESTAGPRQTSAFPQRSSLRGTVASLWEGRKSRNPDGAARRAAWRDAAWTALIGHADRVLRHCQGVIEFTDDPECVLRVALCRAPASLILVDGTHIRPGDRVGELHFWNEHLPPFPPTGPDLRWAKTMQGRTSASLRLLAQFVQQAPECRTMVALRGCAPFCSRARAARITRVTGRHGFDLVHDAALGRPWHGLGENLVLWALARSFNPVATRRQPFRREKHELWISRGQLLDRYAGDRTGGPLQC